MDDQSVQSFQAELICEETKTTDVKNFSLQSHPSTFLDIKKAIEKNFSIPVCVQTLFHQSCKVADLDTPLSFYVRSGDTFTVRYPSNGDCEKVFKVIEWLGKLAEALSQKLQSIQQGCRSCEADSAYKTLLSREYTKVSRDLTTNLLAPWTDRTKRVNKLHIASLGGVELLMKVYKSTVDARLDNITLFRSQYLEEVCSLFIANFMETFPQKRYIIELGGLELCVKSFLCSSLISNPRALTRGAINVIEISLWAINNISEFPECQLKLARNSDVIEQALHMAKSPMFDFEIARISILFIQSLAECTETHPYLLQPKVVDGLIEACKIRRAQSQEHDTAPVTLESYVCTFIAYIAIQSSHCLLLLQAPLLKKMCALMQSVCATNPRDITAYEMKDDLCWSTFLPHMICLYVPIDTPISAEDKQLSSLITELCDVSMKIVLHALHSALGKESNVKTFVGEGLMDYLVPLAWHVPESSRVLLKDLVKDISKLTVIKPPSLCSLAKAKLAKDSLGLKKVKDMISISDLFT